MSKVQAWEAADGTLHRTEEPADRHDMAREITMAFEQKRDMGYQFWPANIAEIILNDLEKFRKILGCS